MERLLATLAPAMRPFGAESPARGESVSMEMLQAETHLYVVDLEMSGPNPQMHEVLDLGGVRAGLEPGLPEHASFGTRVKPRHIGNAEPGALKVVGYSAKAWKEAIDLEPAFVRFEEVGRGAIITGWGIGQDLTFLAETVRRLNRPWPFANVVLDVQIIARAVLRGGGGDVDRFNLGHVADRLGIGRMGEHGALPDAYATYDVLVKLLERAAGPL